MNWMEKIEEMSATLSDNDVSHSELGALEVRDR